MTFVLERPFPGATFGGRLTPQASGGAALITAAEQYPDTLACALATCGGLLLLPGMETIADDPALLVRLSRLLGPEVEDYRQTATPRHMVHETAPEIFVVSNIPPASRPPPLRGQRQPCR